MTDNGRRSNPTPDEDIALAERDQGDGEDQSYEDSAETSACPPPEDPIQQAERELREAQGKLADAKDQAKRDDEITKAIAQYRGEQLLLEAEAGALQAQLTEGMEELKPTDAEKKAVDEVKDSAKKEENTLETSVTKQRKALEALRSALANTTTDLAKAKEKLEALKARGKNVQTKHRTAEGFRKEAFAAIAEGKRHLAYYLLSHRFQAALDEEPHPIEVADYETEIRRKSDRVGALATKLRTDEATIKEKEKKLTADEKKLADLRSNLEATIRSKLASRP